MNLSVQIDAVRARIAAAADRAGRDPSEVVLIAVTKTFPADVCKRVVDAGVADLGENRAQELKEKMKLVDGARWHFIGHLQTNKVRAVVGGAELIHSVDRFELASALARRANAVGRPQEVLIQVNVAGDESKHGVAAARALELAHEVGELDGLAVRGLMTMPPYPLDPEDSRPLYKELAALRNSLVESMPSASGLSMGMTRDFEVAVEEGATFVRVGEALFGHRKAS